MKLNKKGFTLIELMVAIAIIAILATVIITALRSARDATEDANRANAITQLRSAIEVHHTQSMGLNYKDLYDGTGKDFINLLYTYGDYQDFDKLSVNDHPDYSPTNTDPWRKVLRVNVNDSNVMIDGKEYSPYRAYCAQMQLKGDSRKYYCLDYKLTIKGLTDTTESGPCWSSNDYTTKRYYCP